MAVRQSICSVNYQFGYYLLKSSRRKNANGYPLQLRSNGELEMMVDCLGFREVHSTKNNRFYYTNLNGDNHPEFVPYPKTKEQEGEEEPLFIQVDKTSHEIKLIYNGKRKPYLAKVTKETALKQKEGCDSWDMLRMSV